MMIYFYDNLYYTIIFHILQSTIYVLIVGVNTCHTFVKYIWDDDPQTQDLALKGPNPRHSITMKGGFRRVWGRPPPVVCVPYSLAGVDHV